MILRNRIIVKGISKGFFRRGYNLFLWMLAGFIWLFRNSKRLTRKDGAPALPRCSGVVLSTKKVRGPDAKKPDRMLHPTTFEYLKPNPTGLALMQSVRKATSEYVHALEEYLPDGPDKTYLLRKAREVGVWANVAITRTADGTPRPDYTEEPKPSHFEVAA